MNKDYVEKVYVVDSLEVAKYLLNECNFKLISAKAQKESDHKVMFRFEDTSELRKAIYDYNELIGYNKK